MNSTDDRTTVGLAELRDELGRFVERASAGEEIVITHRGREVARLVPKRDKLQELIDRGVVRMPTREWRELPPPIKAKGSVSDLIRR